MNFIIATHYILGKDYQPYLTETSSNYRSYSENKANYENNTSALQGSHFTIGDPKFMNQKT